MSRQLLLVTKAMRATFTSGPNKDGSVAQLGERLICIQEVRSSILLGSTIPRFARHGEVIQREQVFEHFRNAEMSVLNRLWCANAHSLREYAASHPNDLLRRSFDIV